ncbi:MAG: hypothetical protein M0Z43_07015 [Acidithiobacillus sp.]|jgi:hypothetical protein|nr:hypothetical protein [Acidithiobacillus sp.]
MTFEIIVGDLSELMEAKRRARKADMQAILEGRISAKEVHDRNAAFKNVREWTEINTTQDLMGLDDDDDLEGGVIIR